MISGGGEGLHQLFLISNLLLIKDVRRFPYLLHVENRDRPIEQDGSRVELLNREESPSTTDRESGQVLGTFDTIRFPHWYQSLPLAIQTPTIITSREN